MTRSGYSDGGDYVDLWRGAVSSAISGKRGQTFLRDLIAALDAMPEKRLITEELHIPVPFVDAGSVCAIGSVGMMRGVNMAALNPHDHQQLSRAFNIAPAMVAEIEYLNDEEFWRATPDERWQKMRDWASSNLREENA